MAYEIPIDSKDFDLKIKKMQRRLSRIASVIEAFAKPTREVHDICSSTPGAKGCKVTLNGEDVTSRATYAKAGECGIVVLFKFRPGSDPAKSPKHFLIEEDESGRRRAAIETLRGDVRITLKP